MDREGHTNDAGSTQEGVPSQQASRLRFFTDDSYPLAFRYWRRRRGWEAGRSYLYLTMPITVSDTDWTTIEEITSQFASHVRISKVARPDLSLTLFPLGRDGGVPRTNVSGFNEKLSDLLPPLLPYSAVASEIVVIKDHIALKPPTDCEFFTQIGDFYTKIADQTGISREFWPRGIWVDLAYCEADDAWTAAVDSLKRRRYGAVQINSCSLQIEVTSMLEDRYDSHLLHTFSKDEPAEPIEAIKRQRGQAPDSNAEKAIDANTDLIWHVNNTFHFQSEWFRRSDHVLVDFMRQISSELQAEYLRIQRRATEDPGTAGDEGESNWKEVFDRWLPSTYHVVTKGRIISPSGGTSPQIDVLVLHPSYPEALRNKKLYLADGVAAAFECKLTLRRRHFPAILKSARYISSLVPSKGSSPAEQARSEIIFGVLAHSSEWRPGDHRVVLDELREAISTDTHPRDAIDVLCVANSGTWTYEVSDNSGRQDIEDSASARAFRIPKSGAIHSQYLGWTTDEAEVPFGPIYVLIEKLWNRLADQDPTLEGLATHLHKVDTPLIGKFGVARSWPMDIVFERKDQ